MKEQYYITTAIDYINGKPHIGHAYEKVAADVLARFYRARNRDVRFLTGTDEHGAKVEQFAATTGIPVEQFAEETAKGFKAAWDNLNVSYDRFIRTTDKDHETVVQEIVNKIKERGYLYEADYEGLYCVGHEAFVTEKDLVDGKCPEHQKAPELIKEKNWFFQLSEFTQTVKDKIENDELKIHPASAKKEILSMLGEGYKDLAVTRPNVKWGIAVPWDAEQTVYVWVDALFNYYTGAKTADKNYWPADVHVIGPDIAKFHCIIWPALLLAADLPLPKEILVHGFLTLNHQKLSKTTGNIIDPNDWVDQYGADSVRYFLLREVPFESHGDIGEDKLRARYDGDLANGLGNLLSRVTTLVEKYLEGVIPASTEPSGIALNEQDIDKSVESYRFHEALAKIWEWVAEGNKLVDENKLWELGKTDLKKFASVSKQVLLILETSAKHLAPFMPDVSEKILAAVHADKIIKAEPLFPRIQE